MSGGIREDELFREITMGENQSERSAGAIVRLEGPTLHGKNGFEAVVERPEDSPDPLFRLQPDGQEPGRPADCRLHSPAIGDAPPTTGRRPAEYEQEIILLKELLAKSAEVATEARSILLGFPKPPISMMPEKYPRILEHLEFVISAARGCERSHRAGPALRDGTSSAGRPRVRLKPY